MVTAAFLSVGSGAGHYESFYLKATRPGGGRAVWIRYTVHKRPGEALTGSLWFTTPTPTRRTPSRSRISTASLRAPAPAASGRSRTIG